jgi:uncharacterized protein (DUF1697 family)
MPRYVGLLRGVNVGGKNKLPMAELRKLVDSLGHTEVTTFIQSGNVVFTASKPIEPESLEKAIAEQFAIKPVVVLRTVRELGTAVSSNPYARADLSKVHVGFMTHKPSAAVLKKLDTARFLPEEFAFRDRELYLFLPNGMGRTKLPAYLDRQLKIPTTVRNWNTVTKLLELAGG